MLRCGERAECEASGVVAVDGSTTGLRFPGRWSLAMVWYGSFGMVGLDRMVVVKVSGWCAAAYPGPDTPGVAGLSSWAPMNLAEIVLEREAKDIGLILRGWSYRRD
jgi:hypothetical protein